MSNTTLRIISAIVLMLIVAVAGYFGPNGILILLFGSGLLLVDELVFKMFGKKRKHFSYLTAIGSFIAGYILINYMDPNPFFYDYLIHTGVALNTVLIAYLFFEKMDSKLIITFMQRNSFGMGIFFLVPICSMAYLVTLDNWLNLIFLMLLINYLVDTGAWFFGRNFGNKKLWPSISPKKTYAGAIGGAFVSVFISSLYIFYSFNKLNLLIIVSLLILTMIAQMGDLIESKFKRQLGVKDSSNLIPGHGGIYDRLDSLIFVAPFYVMMVKYLF